MPQWIHDRADHIRRKNPGMEKSQAFAIATQQSHAAGKSPKGYGTPEGRREAKRKYDEPKRSYVQTANPSQKSKTASSLAFWKGFTDEFVKIAMTTPKHVMSMGRPPKAPKLTPTSMPRDTAPMSPPQSLLSTKSTQPPPVTA